MKFLLLLMASFAAAQDLPQLLLPTAPPTITKSDPHQCATEDLSGFFQPSQPTGALSTAFLSWGRHLNSEEPCTFTGTERQNCPLPAANRWCAFTTTAPTDMLPAWSSYGSSASSWWEAHSSSAISLAQLCPCGWYNAMWWTPGGRADLNRAIVMSGCYDEARTTASSAGPTGSATSSTPGRTRGSTMATITRGPNTLHGTAIEISESKRNVSSSLLLGVVTALTVVVQMFRG